MFCIWFSIDLQKFYVNTQFKIVIAGASGKRSYLALDNRTNVWYIWAERKEYGHIETQTVLAHLVSIMTAFSTLGTIKGWQNASGIIAAQKLRILIIANRICAGQRKISR